MGKTTRLRVVRGGKTEELASTAYLAENPLRSLKAVEGLLGELHYAAPVTVYVRLAAAKLAYEELHPETKWGGAPGKPGGGKLPKPENISSFETIAAKAMKCTTRSIRSWCSTAEGLTAEAYDVVSQGEWAYHRGALARLSKLSPTEQVTLARLANQRGCERQALRRLYKGAEVTPIKQEDPVRTAVVGHNADLIAEVARIYIKPKMRVADVTYGNGNFWSRVDVTKYVFHPSDIHTTPEALHDFRRLPYKNGSHDVVVFDPPWMHSHGIERFKYNNFNASRESTHAEIMKLYVSVRRNASSKTRDGVALSRPCRA
jgi:hypothetical protein